MIRHAGPLTELRAGPIRHPECTDEPPKYLQCCASGAIILIADVILPEGDNGSGFYQRYRCQCGEMIICLVYI